MAHHSSPARPVLRWLGSTFGRTLIVLLLAALFALGAEALVLAQSNDGLAGLAHCNRFALGLAASAVAALLGLGWALCNRLLPAALAVAALLGLLAQAHVQKVQVLAKPLVPWDLLEWRQIAALLQSVASGHARLFALVLAGLLGLGAGALFLLTRRARWPIHPATRLATAALCACYLFALVGWRSPQLRPLFERWEVVNVLWDNNANVRGNGLLLTLLLNVRSLAVSQPGYSKEAVAAALAPYAEPAAPEKQPALRPDVVLYMGEAFWDPTLLGVHFSRDPIPALRELWASSGARTLLSPAYGGGTANVEFEILTGIPLALLPEDSFPYQHYVTRPLESLPSLFRDRGYRTLAVHPFHSWYWARNVVYPLLGFERFIALEQMEPVPREGPYPSDEPLVDRLLQELDAADGQPTFALAISMVSHCPYLYERKPEPEVKVLDALAPETVHELENYASALFRADRALGRLVEALKTRSRPTLLVAFGDHLPALGKKRATYRETGFLPEGELTALAGEDAARQARVPLALWSNFPFEPPPAELGMPFLGPYVLRAAGIEPTGYFALLGDLSTRVTAVQSNLVRAGQRWYLGPKDPSLPAATRKEVDRLFLLGYDRLLGSGYGQQQPTGLVADR